MTEIEIDGIEETATIKTRCKKCHEVNKIVITKTEITEAFNELTELEDQDHILEDDEDEYEPY